MRTNIYKEKVLGAFKGAHLLSITDIQRKIPKADFSTIFRNLDQLCRAGMVRKVTVSKDVVLYEVVDEGHRHDHFVCSDCGVIETIYVPVRSITKGRVHDVVVHGMCEKCEK